MQAAPSRCGSKRSLLPLLLSPPAEKLHHTWQQRRVEPAGGSHVSCAESSCCSAAATVPGSAGGSAGASARSRLLHCSCCTLAGATGPHSPFGDAASMHSSPAASRLTLVSTRHELDCASSRHRMLACKQLQPSRAGHPHQPGLTDIQLQAWAAMLRLLGAAAHQHINALQQ